MATIVKLGHYNPPILWHPNKVIEMSPNRWLQMIESVKKDGKMDAFKMWLRDSGILVRFVMRGKTKVIEGDHTDV